VSSLAGTIPVYPGAGPSIRSGKPRDEGDAKNAIKDGVNKVADAATKRFERAL
jgi:hypothetical protein